MKLSLPYPVSANRYWRTYRGKSVLSEEARAFKLEAFYAAKVAGMKLIDGPVDIALVFHPKANKDGSANAKCLDLDNVVKVSLDALNKIAYEDDKQVKRISVEFGNPIHKGGLTVSIEEFRA